MRMQRKELFLCCSLNLLLVFLYLGSMAVLCLFISMILRLFQFSGTWGQSLGVVLVLYVVILCVGWWFDPPIKWTTHKQDAPKPPLNAAFLFHLFMTPQNADAITGDLEERYKIISKKFGKGKADFWFWSQTITSIGPIVWAATKRVMRKLIIPATTAAVAKGLLSDHSWLASVVEIWKRAGL